MKLLALVLFSLALNCAQTQVEPGVFPATWMTGGPNCLELPDWQVHEYNPAFYVLRQSGCIHYEKPFLYLIFGKQRALLVDTGAGASDAAAFSQKLVARWARRNQRESVPLVVAHSHGHVDHVAGDKGFDGMAGVTLVTAAVPALQKAFGIARWPEQAGSIDLGERVIDVIPMPGHQPAAVAYYDRQTGILLTGDNLYPGRLYISDFPAYLASTRRLVQFTEGQPVAHILGCHIEQSATPFVDYPAGTTYQPREHSLELGRAHLLELLAGLEQMQAKPVKLALRDFTIVPREPQPGQQKK
ncbi:MAG TPA: MBL fold metallo-hydrolase [Candidatus Acidoferrales bacterium]|jgi:hydroxyacylglutathione hydrolase|nr:MBL fold metallo-hydrolase [Candidatus Acidoferrales bacterium]